MIYLTTAPGKEGTSSRTARAVKRKPRKNNGKVGKYRCIQWVVSRVGICRGIWATSARETCYDWTMKDVQQDSLRSNSDSLADHLCQELYWTCYKLQHSGIGSTLDKTLDRVLHAGTLDIGEDPEENADSLQIHYRLLPL